MKKRILSIRRYLVEIKLGVFCLVALILFFIAILSIREVSFFKGTYLVRVKFKFAEGLKPASPVRFCGVDVGEVKRLEIKKEEDLPIVYVHAKIEKGIVIPRDSKFFINSLTLFGEKYLEIIPPPSASGTYVRGDEIIEGINSPPLFNIMSSIHRTMLRLDEFIKEGKIKASLEETIVNINETSKEIKGLIIDIKNKEGTVGRLLYDDSLYRLSEEFLDDLKRHPWKLLYKPRETKRRR